MDPNSLLLYAITDCDHLQGQALLDRTEELLQGGATMLQYRDKQGLARQDVPGLQALCKKYGVPFIVNDDVDLARAINADGVHVGQEDQAAAEARAQLGPDKIVGVSAKSVAQAKKAQADGADYLGVGALHPSPSKQSSRVSRQTLKDICASVSIPVVGIGGMSEANMATLAATGARGAAFISALYGLPHPLHAAERMAERLAFITGGDSAMAGLACDVDGTLADTRGFYEHLIPDFMEDEGYTTGPDFAEITAAWSMPEAAVYAKHNHSVTWGLGEMVNELEYRLEDYYHGEAQARPGVLDFLKACRRRSLPVAAVSIHDAEVCRTLFDHTGLASYVDDIASGWDDRLGGGDSRLYTKAAGLLPKGRLWAFEDSLHGIFAAKGAGFRVAAMKEEHQSLREWDQMVKNADVAFESWQEACDWLQ